MSEDIQKNKQKNNKKQNDNKKKNQHIFGTTWYLVMSDSVQNWRRF